MRLTALTVGTVYEVLARLVDAQEQVFEPGERLTFVSRSYLSHDEGHTLRFRERTMWLEGAGPVARDLGRYLRAVGPAPAPPPLSLADLVPGAAYDVLDTFLDSRRTWFTAGERLTFVAGQPAPDGEEHVAHFREKVLALWTGHDVARYLARYLRRVDDGPAPPA
jgi:hypothetical protein